MSIEKKLLGTTPPASGDTPEGVSFDGSSDYLSRSSDLSGNADGKTFTFSAWVYTSPTVGTYTVYGSGGGSNYFQVVAYSGNELRFFGFNSSGSLILNARCGSETLPVNTMSHVLISIDMSSSSNRKVYVNDKSISGINWVTFTDDSLNFTNATHGIGALGGNDKLKGRLAHVFLDYTYRNLSVESNRRLFIDSDGKPSDTIPSSPILYLPMTDAATAGSNSGTGGDFTVNGVLDTAGRAPNQFNCSASKFDGVNDYLSRSSIAGISDGKQFTFSCVVNGGSTHGDIFSIGTGSWPSKFAVDISSDYVLRFSARNASSTYVLSWYANLSQRLRGATNLITVSVDTTNQSGSKVFINNVDSGGSFATFTNDSIDFTASEYFIGADYSTGKADSVIGELYFDTAYTDLSTDNPFWDADANRPKPVRQVISETGTTPLIALPLRGDDAGNNLGSGGDFTVNSGPYTGARGGSEFWARSAKFASSSNLNKWSTGGSATSRVFTMAYNLNSPTIGTSTNIEINDAVKFRQTGSSWLFWVTDNSSNNLAYITFSVSLAANTDYMVLFCFDVDNSSNNKVYINGQPISLTQSFINAGNIDLANTIYIPQTGPTGVMISGLYFDDSYIDFSQESNRNLFVDQLGYPKDLTPAIEAGDIADPLVYLKFDDISSLGTNAGTSGNFTVTGTVTAGADVDPNA